ncbi:MAG: hypothetical protein WB676_16735 [Bryobacteraceae bacterium]
MKAAADLSSKDPESSGRVFREALEAAESLHDLFWIGRVTGELAVIAPLIMAIPKWGDEHQLHTNAPISSRAKASVQTSQQLRQQPS